MPQAQQTADAYLAAFNETDPRIRREMLDALYDSDSTYTDPHVDVQGPDQIDAFIAATQERFPGFRFALAGPIDSHHDQMRFQWKAGPADANDPLYLGFDVIITNDRKIRHVYGFSDPSTDG